MTVAAARNFDAEAIGYWVSGWMPPKLASYITLSRTPTPTLKPPDPLATMALAAYTAAGGSDAPCSIA